MTDAAAYPLTALVALYGSRWQVGVRYRELKTTLGTLGMQYLDVRSAAVFRLELEVGLLAYNLIRAAVLHTPGDLNRRRRCSFAAARRRVALAWRPSRPSRRADVRVPVADWLAQLAVSRSVSRTRWVAHEPRALWRTPQTYAALKGSRQPARDAVLLQLGAISS